MCSFIIHFLVKLIIHSKATLSEAMLFVPLTAAHTQSGGWKPLYTHGKYAWHANKNPDRWGPVYTLPPRPAWEWFWLTLTSEVDSFSLRQRSRPLVRVRVRTFWPKVFVTGASALRGLKNMTLFMCFLWVYLKSACTQAASAEGNWSRMKDNVTSFDYPIAQECYRNHSIIYFILYLESNPTRE